MKVMEDKGGVSSEIIKRVHQQQWVGLALISLVKWRALHRTPLNINLVWDLETLRPLEAPL